MTESMYVCKKCNSENVEIRQSGKLTGAYCKDCNAWIQWLDQKDIKVLYKYIKEKFGGNGKAFRSFIKRKNGTVIIKCSNCKCQFFNSDAPEPIGQFNLKNAKFCPKCGVELY